jgi:hypothetical protein
MGRVLGALAVLALTGCGGAAERGASGTDPSPTTCAAPGDVRAPRALTSRLDLGDAVGWSSVEAGATSVNAVGIAPDTDLATVLATSRDAVDAAGWEPLTLDDEGFEAELLARDDAGGLLAVNLRESTCPGQVLVAVSITEYDELS